MPLQAATTQKPAPPEMRRPPRRVQVGIFLAIVVPFLAVLVTPVLVWGWGFHWVDLGLLVGMYGLTILGVSIGFHRLFVHRSFETSRWMKVLLGIIGSMAVEGPLLRWVAMHRRHHQHSDTPLDPHTPHHREAGLRGFWHAHIGWLFAPAPADLERYSRDLARDPTLRWVSRHFALWVALGLLLPAALGGWLTGSWRGALTGFIWGGLVRVFLVHHVTWSVNSACHLWGARPYRSGDMSRNNPLFGLLALGEGWHNTHHAFPTSARHGLKWRQLDVSYRVIRLLERLGLVWNVKVPTAAQEAARRNQA